MTMLTLPAPGKLNLFLHITGRRPDGYHELQTLFALLDQGPNDGAATEVHPAHLHVDDPLEDIGAMQRIHGVIKGGLLVSRGDAVVWPPALGVDL